MAKSKTKKKKSGGRRVGAVSIKGDEAKNFGLMLVGGIAGILGKRLLENTLNAQTAVTINPKVLFIGEAVAGSVIGIMVKNPLAKGLGIAIASASTLQLLQSMGVLNGIPAGMPFFKLPEPRPHNMSGAARAQTIGNVNPYGYPVPSSVGRVNSTARRYAGGGN